MYDIEKQKKYVKLKLKNSDLDNSIDDDTIEMELDLAKDVINDRRGYTPTEESPLEERYFGLQVTLAIESLSKYGAEGETDHSDNGVKRSYDSASPYSNASLDKIIPLGTCFKS